MKHLKRAAGLILALVMIAALGMGAWATETTPAFKVEEHNFVILQLLTGDPQKDADGNVITDENGNVTKEFDIETVNWGSSLSTVDAQNAFLAGIRASGITAAVNAFTGIGDFTEVSQANARTVAEALNKIRQDESISESDYATIAKAVYAQLGSNAGVRQEAGNSVDRDTGWYLLMDEQAADDALNKYLLHTHMDANDPVTPKVNENPELKKEVLDGSGEYGSNAEYKIGDMVTFKITAKIPDGYEHLEEYHMIFTDTQDAGFGTPSSVTVKTIAYTGTGDEVTSTEATMTAGTDYLYTETDNDFTIEINGMRDKNFTDNPYIDLKAGDEIVIEYQAELLDTAALGGLGNANNVKLDYTGAGTPLDSTAKVFTFEFDANKKDGTTGGDLDGAAFSLYKKVPVDSEAAAGASDEDKIAVEGDDTMVWLRVGQYTAEDNLHQFAFKGLTSGEYRLVEDAPPTGYNKIDPIDFTIEATYNNAETEVTKLTLKKGENETVATGGTLSMDVENFRGVVLPSTGGIGTTIFYIGGAVLLIGAVILLVTKRRARFDED